MNSVVERLREQAHVMFQDFDDDCLESEAADLIASQAAEIGRLTKERDGDAFWDAVAEGPTDGPPLSVVDFRRWAGVVSKRVAAAKSRAETAERLLAEAIEGKQASDDEAASAEDRVIETERERDDALRLLAEATGALEKAQQFIVNGVEMGFIQMPEADTPDPAHYTLPLIGTTLSNIRGHNG